MIARHTRFRLLIGAWCVLLLVNVAHASTSDYPVFADDGELHQLDAALNRSLAFLRTISPATRYQVAGRKVPAQRLINSALHLQRLLQSHPSAATLNQEIRQAYEVVQVNTAPNGAPKRMLVTGYYQPVFPGRLDRQPPYVHPLYRVPADLLTRQANGKKQVLGRRENGTIVPYWTRREIELGNLLRDQELVWLKDPFDAFVLHVQGSGIIRLPDGSQRGVHYAVNNGHAYRSVGKFMVDTGRMRLADVTMDSLRRYLDQHPAEREPILHHNDSFIFFAWSRPGPAIGSLGQELTPGRSIAVDQKWYPPGSLVFIDSRRPLMADGEVREWQRMRRLVTVQDTGSALTGPGRIDVFWGTGDQAGQEAGQMKEEGMAYLLLLKEGLEE
jgi:membrane-bound lytic murein transglycosylase A